MKLSEVAAIRKRTGLTQTELAGLSGVAQPNIAAYENGKRRPSTKMLERLNAAAKPKPSVVLKAHKAEVREIAKRHKATAVKVFGSVATGKDKAGSDVDLLVTFAADATLYDQIELAQEVEELLGVGVDVVSDGGLRGRRTTIRQEARPL